MVDGRAGIARRIAALTAGQGFVRDRKDFAVFTGPGGEALAPALAAYGLTRSEAL